MTDIIVKQMPLFKKFYKIFMEIKKKRVNAAILAIINNPTIGEEKKGDLAGVYIYKFKINNQEYLLAYEWDPLNRILLALGVHENFYRDLKKSL